MNISIIQERLKEYQIGTVEQEVNALKEIVQEIILYGLSTVDFFDKALFHGGTALRILYGLQRFSEDMDFILKKPDRNFQWKKYVDAIEAICKEYGVMVNIKDKSKTEASVQRLFVKNDSIGKFFDLSFKHLTNVKITIKLEIDVNPPFGSVSETKYLDFPMLYAVEAQDLESNFANKSHALLCRSYTKGRDWYDFLWYVSKKTLINFNLLQNAINQMGPWADQNIKVTSDWYISQLRKKVKSIDWVEAKSDVMRFLGDSDRQQLSLWGNDLFLWSIDKLEDIL